MADSSPFIALRAEGLVRDPIRTLSLLDANVCSRNTKRSSDWSNQIGSSSQQRTFELHTSMGFWGRSQRHAHMALIGARDEPCNHVHPTASRNFAQIRFAGRQWKKK